MGPDSEGGKIDLKNCSRFHFHCYMCSDRQNPRVCRFSGYCTADSQADEDQNQLINNLIIAKLKDFVSHWSGPSASTESVLRTRRASSASHILKFFLSHRSGHSLNLGLQKRSYWGFYYVFRPRDAVLFLVSWANFEITSPILSFQLSLLFEIQLCWRRSLVFKVL